MPFRRCAPLSGLIVLGGWLSLFWLAMFWWMTLDNPRRWGTVLYAGLASILAVVLNSPEVWVAAGQGYPSDSFWTLGTGARFAIGGGSAVGLGLIFWLISTKTKRLLNGRQSTAILFVGDCLLGLAIFAILFAVSPQMFYEVYRWANPILPAQVIIDIPRELGRLATASTLPVTSALADHVVGACLLAVIPFTAWQHARTFAGSGPRVWLLVTAWASLQLANIL